MQFGGRLEDSHFAGRAGGKITGESLIGRIVEAVEDKAARMKAEREAREKSAAE